MMRYTEPHLAERIEQAKELARKVKSGENIETDTDAERVLRFVLARHYHMPYFDEYFDKRTLDELFFEVALVIPEEPMSDADKAKAAQGHKEEVNEVIDEFDQWLQQGEPRPDMEQSNAAIDSKFEEIAKKFMETGEFVGENPNKESEDAGK